MPSNLFPQALDDRAGLENEAFIFAPPGTQLVIISGKDDWEYYFSQHNNNKITGRCNSKPWEYYVRDGVKFTLCKIPQLLSTELSVVERVKNLMNAFENLHKT